jgi:hypothetical protein
MVINTEAEAARMRFVFGEERDRLVSLARVDCGWLTSTGKGKCSSHDAHGLCLAFEEKKWTGWALVLSEPTVMPRAKTDNQQNETSEGPLSKRFGFRQATRQNVAILERECLIYKTRMAFLLCSAPGEKEWDFFCVIATRSGRHRILRIEPSGMRLGALLVGPRLAPKEVLFRKQTSISCIVCFDVKVRV